MDILDSHTNFTKKLAVLVFSFPEIARAFANLNSKHTTENSDICVTTETGSSEESKGEGNHLDASLAHAAASFYLRHQPPSPCCRGRVWRILNPAMAPARQWAAHPAHGVRTNPGPRRLPSIPATPPYRRSPTPPPPRRFWPLLFHRQWGWQKNWGKRVGKRDLGVSAILQ